MLQLYNARGDRFAVVADYFSRGLFRMHGRSVNPMKITTVRPKPAAAAGYSEAVRVEAPVKVERLVVPSKISPPTNKLSPSLNSRVIIIHPIYSRRKVMCRLVSDFILATSA